MNNMDSDRYIYMGKWAQSKKDSAVNILSAKDKDCAVLNENSKYYAGDDGENYEYLAQVGRRDVGTYFKICPIKWRIIDERDGVALAVCEDIIDVQDFGGESNYKNSQIRYWLNEYFFVNAFDRQEKDVIVTSAVDNSAKSTGQKDNIYACDNTNDKVFLLSYQEAFDVYGLSEDDRQKEYSDYALFKSAYGCDGDWWLRSADGNDEYSALAVDSKGRAVSMPLRHSEAYDYAPYVGVAPAIKIKL